MNRVGNDFLTLVFPPKCFLCGGARVRGEPEICSSCYIRLPRERNYDGYENNTVSRLQGMLKFEEAYSFLRFSKKSSVQQLLHQVKYRGNAQLGYYLGKWFASEVLYKVRNHFQLVVPVPLHAERLRTRGYNQCLEIARGIIAITGHRISDALRRECASETQTHLSRWERFENTANEFILPEARLIKGRHILLLDDIITTGATITGSAIPLIEGGAGKLIIGAVGLTQEF